MCVKTQIYLFKKIQLYAQVVQRTDPIPKLNRHVQIRSY